MGWYDLYRQKLAPADEAVKLVQSGDWVDYGNFAGQVVDLDRALARRRDELSDVKVRAATRVAGVPEIVRVDPEGKHFIYNNWHLSGIDRSLSDQGLCYYIPILFRDVPRYYRQYIDVDVAMIAVTPMDRHGFFNFGLQNASTRATLEKAKKIILEVNENMPRVPGGREECVHITEVDCVVESSNWPIPTAPLLKSAEIDQKIAQLVVSEIEDGSCIQLGIGSMPNAIGELIARSDLKDLGVHTEMFVDAYMDMYSAGRITGRRKNIDTGKMVFTFCMGTKELYDFVDENPAIASYPVNYTNRIQVIGENDNVVSINGAIEMDLFGQICAESSGTRQISGTGGQLDFFVGAFLSRGGKAFCCFSSTFADKKGKITSRIKPLLSPGAIVTTPRSVAMYIVTEYGMVNLKGKSTWERAEDLISIAHPAFREELIAEAEKIGIWRRSNRC
ncbi:acetyl-CoA hydrolase/transferase family protein [Desulfotomaculum copahuensis]|uniref:Probable butyrate:acetyl-CoA coenzyme A-transferase n=1 Tax=Desulfotomaculum copahuensis TaxID=1838280 RepID=A0A1B7LD15_9FIRM|nr:acetyl-CoA hydrolase/transferase C-terminal domain-containing protein [Desulfotomaculum copahuensis]OAT80764.1 butyryl-CoA:acetate CoA-transferase [Desulfotomaculum copahuensis]